MRSGKAGKGRAGREGRVDCGNAEEADWAIGMFRWYVERSLREAVSVIASTHSGWNLDCDGGGCIRARTGMIRD